MEARDLDMRTSARALVARGKGILAADESFPTIEKRFKPLGVESTEENRRAYRGMLFSAPGVEAHISGVILFDETIRQEDPSGVPFPELLASRGIIPGIKVDKGAKPLAGCPGEKRTEGLDGLRERLAQYRELGARFTKWRAVYSITEDTPTATCIRTNAADLALYAALAQEAGLVPIVEPEVLMDGTHTIERSACVTGRVLQTLFDELYLQHVDLEGLLLKPNMVLSGYDCPEQASHEQVAEETVRCLRRHVPAAVPGIVFLSGGQSEETATLNLDHINRQGQQPWELSFSFGRALQATAMQMWARDPSDVAAAQAAYEQRAKASAAARAGRYEASPVTAA